MENRPVWKHQTFANFFKQSPLKAYQYRKDCLWCEIPEEFQPKINIIEPVITEEMVELKKEVDEEIKVLVEKDLDNIEFTRADLIEKLNTAWIKFMPNSKDETLLKKCVENNLI